jgi:1,4-dihydroxy-2-naphthoate octaprenyltransferase
MVRSKRFLLSLPAVIVGLLVANHYGQLSSIVALLGILAIVGFAILATGWTEDHDVSD